MPELKVYSTNWCPDCRNLKRFLDAEHVTYDEIDIDKDDQAAQDLVESTGKRGIPFMRLEDIWIKGYPMDPGAFRKRLKELGLL